MRDEKKPGGAWVEGSINWYDPSSGRGSIIGDDGVWYRIHEFVQLQDKLKGQLREKTRIQFELAKDSIHPIVKSLREVKAPSKIDSKRSRPRSVRPGKTLGV